MCCLDRLEDANRLFPNCDTGSIYTAGPNSALRCEIAHDNADPLRGRVTDPDLDRLPGQGRVTSH
jgi:hypothetical protein